MKRGGVVGLLSALLTCGAGCGSAAPTSPTAAVTTVTTTTTTVSLHALPGIWTGYLNAQRCIAGQPCTSAFENVVFTLRMIEDSGGISGFIEINKDKDQGWFPITLDIRGVIQPDGSVRFSSLYTPAESDNATIDIGEFVVTTSATTGLSGPIDIGGWWPDSHVDRRYRGSIASAAWRPLDAAPGVAGGWSGQGIIRSCSGVCVNSLSAGRPVAIDLQLGQSGSAAFGRIDFDFLGSVPWFPVSGTMNGDALSLSSEPQPKANAVQPVRLVQFSTSVDRRGMMRGHFTFDGDSTTPFTVARPFRLECDILWLTRDY